MRAFLEQIPPHLRSTIRTFTTDMWEGYINAVQEYLVVHTDVTAKVVIDRFHVSQQYRDNFDTLRKQELKRLKQALPAQTYAQDCQGSLWLLRHNHADLEPDERRKLRGLLQHSPCLHQAYTLREELTALFNQCQSVSEGEHRLTSWVKKVEQNQATCFRPFIKTLTNHWQLILNYFADRVTSGFVEGLNNKIRTITRRCYGIRKTTTLFQRLWLDLEKHRFFAPKRPLTLSTT